MQQSDMLEPERNELEIWRESMYRKINRDLSSLPSINADSVTNVIDEVSRQVMEKTGVRPRSLSQNLHTRKELRSMPNRHSVTKEERELLMRSRLYMIVNAAVDHLRAAVNDLRNPAPVPRFTEKPQKDARRKKPSVHTIRMPKTYSLGISAGH